jgi:Abortive infection alpha
VATDPTDGDDGRRPRPRPGPGLQPPAGYDAPGRPPSRQLAAPTTGQTGQVVAAAGNAIITAARVGRLLGRTGWRMARQLPGAAVLEQQAQRLRQAAETEMRRLLDGSPAYGTATPEEQRAMLLVQRDGGDPEPLRSAMTELLERSAQSNTAQGRDYLFGTIVSQLVPDEARILAVLSDGRAFPALDVVARTSRTRSQIALANISTVASAAGVSWPQNGSTYLTRLRGFGLVEFGPAPSGLERQFAGLEADPAVVSAQADIDRGKGSARLVRKTVTLSPMGREFWTACAPRRGALDRRRD